jgi:hypothetical protein
MTTEMNLDFFFFFLEDLNHIYLVVLREAEQALG